jgi:DNA polymerase-4
MLRNRTFMSRTLPSFVHLDADAFFVSVEQALNPALRGKKVAVGGRERGIISSASYEARACGVFTPMPTARALKVCPDLILVDHSSGRYGEFSRRLFDLCETLTPLVERRSVDEGFLDVGPCGFKTATEVEAAVCRLQARIWDELQITISFGVAANKLVSAIASKLNKPRGFTVVQPGGERAFLAPLSIGKLPGIGAKTEAALNALGIRLVSDIQSMDEAALKAAFGTGWREVFAAACGRDESEVETEDWEAKSYSQQETFAIDIKDFAEKIRYANFEQMSAGHSIDVASDLETPFYPWVAPLLKKAWTQRRPLRLVSMRFSGVDELPQQLEMFSETDEKRKRLASALDALKARRGSCAVVRGAQIK